MAWVGTVFLGRPLADLVGLQRLAYPSFSAWVSPWPLAALRSSSGRSGRWVTASGIGVDPDEHTSLITTVHRGARICHHAHHGNYRGDLSHVGRFFRVVGECTIGTSSPREGRKPDYRYHWRASASTQAHGPSWWPKKDSGHQVLAHRLGIDIELATDGGT